MKNNLLLQKARQAALGMLFPIVAVALALALGAVLIAVAGKNPLEAYAALFQGAFGGARAIAGTITKATPLVFVGLSLSFGFTCQVFNMGGEGQLVVGAFTAALLGCYMQGVPRVLHIVIVFAGGMLAGALWALIPALLKVRRGVHEVISTIMMNNIAALVVHYLIISVFKAPGEITATSPIADSARLSKLTLGKNIQISTGILVALAVVVLVWVFLNRTTRGFEIKAVGLNPETSRYVGIRSNKNILIAFLLSGMLASLAGIVEVTGTFGRIYDGFSPGYGFDGIPVALLASCNPFGVILSSFLFGALRNGSTLMQTSVGISKEIIFAIQAFVILLISAKNVISRLKPSPRVQSVLPAAKEETA